MILHSPFKGLMRRRGFLHETGEGCVANRQATGLRKGRLDAALVFLQFLPRPAAVGSGVILDFVQNTYQLGGVRFEYIEEPALNKALFNIKSC